jgi:hypothetical protein
MRSILTCFLMTVFSAPAFAGYYSVLDTGEVLKSGQYKLTGDAQILTKNGGLNVGGTFDMGFQEQFGLRALVGFGSTDVFAGGLFKWTPIPDVDNQPMIGMNIGVLYGKDDSISDMSVRFEPIVSKRLVVDQTTITPYASLPISIRNRHSEDWWVKDGTRGTFQMVVGSQLQVEKWRNLQFMAEIGLDLDQAPAYLSVAAVFYFDSENGMKLE